MARGGRGPLRTRANALTALRLAGVVPLGLAIASGRPAFAALLFALAVATDLLDGRVARRFGEASPLGGLLDHAADAATVVAGLAALAWRGEVSPVLPLLIAGAFAQYALDSRAFAGRPLRPSALGRANGVAYFVLLGAPLVRDVLALPFPAPALVRALGWLLALTTLLSAADRLRGWSRRGTDLRV
jgi:cardiolipin synthase